MKVLVTGGGGFLGQAICRQLQDRGDEPVALQRSHSSALEQLAIEQRLGDISDADAVSAAAADCRAVIHTAGKAGAWGDPADYEAINVTGTEHVIHACRKHGIADLVYTSSPSVVHAGGDIEGGDETLPYPDHYEAPYPRSKAAGEQAVMAASDASLRTVSLRPHLIWGPGDNQLLPRLQERARKGVIKLPGFNKLIDTVYIDNAAQAHLNALDALTRNPACHGKTYFISNGEPWTQGRLIAALLEASGVTAELKPVSPRLAQVAGALAEWWWQRMDRKDEPPLTRWSAEQLSTAHWYDISAARRDLAYTPTLSIAQGLERLRAASAV